MHERTYVSNIHLQISCTLFPVSKFQDYDHTSFNDKYFAKIRKNRKYFLNAGNINFYAFSKSYLENKFRIFSTFDRRAKEYTFFFQFN